MILIIENVLIYCNNAFKTRFIALVNFKIVILCLEDFHKGLILAKSSAKHKSYVKFYKNYYIINNNIIEIINF